MAIGMTEQQTIECVMHSEKSIMHVINGLIHRINELEINNKGVSAKVDALNSVIEKMNTTIERVGMMGEQNELMGMLGSENMIEPGSTIHIGSSGAQHCDYRAHHAQRIKTWDEATPDEKIERLKTHLLNTSDMLNRCIRVVQDLSRHRHTSDGTVSMSIEDKAYDIHGIGDGEVTIGRHSVTTGNKILGRSHE